MNTSKIALGSIIRQTTSTCPHCLRMLSATIYEKDKEVFMSKTCPTHGLFDVYLWPDVEHYNWCATFDFNPQEQLPSNNDQKDCPKKCGLCPEHKGRITLAEIEITHKCNLSCPVCFMSAGEAMAEPTFDEIKRSIDNIVSRNLEKTSLQITGGEPTLRQDLPDIIKYAKSVGIEVIELNTNGIVLAENGEYLKSLYNAGLTNIYLQFDGVSPEVTEQLRGKSIHSLKLKALDNCRSIGMSVIIAPTIVRGVNDHQLSDIIDFCLENSDVVQGLSFQPAFVSGRFDVEHNKHLSMGDMVSLIEKQTDGRIMARDFYPLNCVSPLCDCSTYIIGDENFYIPLTREITEEVYREHFAEGSSQGSSLIDVALRKYNNRMLPKGMTILIMCFMDAWTLDTDRVQKCNLGVEVSGEKTIPFCAYHLTDIQGKRMYPYGSNRAQCFSCS